MIGKIISDHFGLTEFFGGTVKPKISFETEVDDDELDDLKAKISSLDGDEIRIRAAVDESSLKDIDGLADYAVDRAKQGKEINEEGVNKLLEKQVADQAHGFLGVNSAIKEYNKLTDTASKTKLAEIINTSNSSLGKYLISLDGANTNIVKYTGSLATATLKTFALQTATMAMNAAVSFGVSFVISGILTAIGNYINSVDNAIEASHKAKETIDEANSSFKAQQDLVKESGKRYAELAQHVNQFNNTNLDLKEDEYEEFLELSNQIAEQFPGLIKGYDDNGNAILNLDGTISDINTTLDSYIVKAKEASQIKIVQAFKGEGDNEDYFKGAKEEVDKLKGEADNAKTEIGNLQKLKNSITSKSDDVPDLFNNYANGQDSRIKADYIRKYLEDSGFDKKLNSTSSSSDLLSNFKNMSDKEIISFQNAIKDRSLDGRLSDKAVIIINELLSKYSKDSGYNISAYLTQQLESAKDNYDQFAHDVEEKNQEISENAKAVLERSAIWSNPDTTDEMKTAMTNALNMINWSDEQFKGFDGEQAAHYIQTTFASSFEKLNKDDKITVDKFFDTDPSKISLDEYLALYDRIKAIFEKQGIHIPINIGNAKNVWDDFNKSLEGMSDRDKTTVENYLNEHGIDSASDIEVWNKRTEGIKNATDAIEAYEKKDPELQYNNVLTELEASKKNLKNEIKKLSDWGLKDYSKFVQDGVQTKFGNVDMDKRTIITWSDELKQTYADELASWDYDPEIGGIDTVFGGSSRFGEDLNGSGWEVAFTPILPDGTFLSKDTVTKYLNAIVKEAYADDDKVTDEELKELDAKGRQIGNQFVKGIYAGVDDSKSYENNGNLAETVGRLLHFTGDFGAISIAKKEIEKLKTKLAEINGNDDKQPQKSFKEAWKSLGTESDEDVAKKSQEAKEKLLELAEAGKLTVKAFENSDIAENFLKDTKLSAEEATKKINELVSSADQLSSMKTGISSISTILGEKKENLSSKKTRTKGIGADTLAGMPEDVKAQTKEYEHFIEVLGDGTSTMDECKAASNKLATAYVNSNNFLSNLTDENEDYYMSVLKEMGVENAEAIVSTTVTANKEKQKFKTEALSAATKDMTDNTSNASEEFVKEANMSNLAKVQLADLVAKEKIYASTTLSTSGKVKELNKLAQAYFGVSNAIQISSAMGSDSRYWSDPKKYEKAVQKQWNKFIKKQQTIAVKNLSKIDVSPKSSSSGNKSKGSKSDSSKTKQEIDWIERRVSRLTSKISLLNAQKENLFSVKKKNSNLNKQIKETTKLIGTYSSAVKKYSKKANSVRISKDKKEDASLKKAVRQGRIKSKSMKSLIASYGEKTANKIQEYQNWYDKSESSKQSLADATKQKRELKKEQYQTYADLYNSRISRAEAKEAIGIGYKDKNKSVDTQIKNTKKSYGYQIKIAELENNKAESQKLQYELEKKIAELRLKEIQNIQHDYENRIGLIDNDRQDIENKISLAEARGKIITAEYYRNLNVQQQNKRAKAVSERADIQAKLNESLKSGEIKIYSDEWYDVQSTLQGLDNTINECDTAITENTTAIREVHTAMLDAEADYKNNLNTEADFLANLLSHKEMTDSDTGTFTKEGFGTLGTYAVRLETSQDQIRELNKERAILEAMKKKGLLDYGDNGKHKYNSIEQFEKAYNELIQKQQEWVKSEFDAEQGIIDLMKEYYQAQLDYMKEIIDAKKKALDLEKDLYDYQKNIAEKTKNIALLEKQAAAIQGDTSEEGRARLSKIQLSLDEVNQDLQDTEYERYISDQQNMLDNMYSEYEDLMQRLFKDTDALLRDGITAINGNGVLIKGIIDKTAKDYNYDYSSNFRDIMTAFESSQPIVTGIKESLIGDESSIANILSRINATVEKMYEESGGSDSDNKDGNKEKNKQNGNGGSNNTTGDSNVIIDQYGNRINNGGVGKFGETLHKISPYLNATKGSPKSALNKLLKDKTNSYISNKNNNKDLKKIAKALGVKYDGDYSKDGTVYKYLKTHGFQTGGIVRANSVPLTGDHLPIRVNPNETILTQKFTDMLPTTVNIMDNLQKAIRLPDYVRQVKNNNIGASYGDIHFDIELPNVTNSSTANDMIYALQNNKKVQQVLSVGVKDLISEGRITGNIRNI